MVWMTLLTAKVLCGKSRDSLCRCQCVIVFHICDRCSHHRTKGLSPRPSMHESNVFTATLQERRFYLVTRLKSLHGLLHNYHSFIRKVRIRQDFCSDGIQKIRGNIVHHYSTLVAHSDVESGRLSTVFAHFSDFDEFRSIQAVVFRVSLSCLYGFVCKWRRGLVSSAIDLKFSDSVNFRPTCILLKNRNSRQTQHHRNIGRGFI